MAFWWQRATGCLNLSLVHCCRPRFENWGEMEDRGLQRQRHQRVLTVLCHQALQKGGAGPPQPLRSAFPTRSRRALFQWPFKGRRETRSALHRLDLEPELRLWGGLLSSFRSPSLTASDPYLTTFKAVQFPCWSEGPGFHRGDEDPRRGPQTKEQGWPAVRYRRSAAMLTQGEASLSALRVLLHRFRLWRAIAAMVSLVPLRQRCPCGRSDPLVLCSAFGFLALRCLSSSWSRFSAEQSCLLFPEVCRCAGLDFLYLPHISVDKCTVVLFECRV